MYYYKAIIEDNNYFKRLIQFIYSNQVNMN